MTRAAMLLDTATSTEQPAERSGAVRSGAVRSGAEPAEAPAERLAELVARIGDDARRDPHGYLGRTVVPEGGE